MCFADFSHNSWQRLMKFTASNALIVHRLIRRHNQCAVNYIQPVWFTFRHRRIPCFSRKRFISLVICRLIPARPVGETDDVRRNGPAVGDAVHCGEEGVERFEEVVGVRVIVEELTGEGRPAAVVGQYDDVLGLRLVERRPVLRVPMKL